MAYEPTIPSNFMVGTDQGNVVKCRLQSKLGSKSVFLASWQKV